MLDTFKHKGLRKRLVEQLRVNGITDEQVLAAIDNVPRHLFLDSTFVEIAYQDKAFPIGAGQTISQPSTVAFQTQLLALKKGEKVLEIGTGSGYQSCVLAEMGVKVFTIERQKALFDKTKQFLSQFHYPIKPFYGDGYLGLPLFAPFDKVLITAGAPFIPEDLVAQLKVGGILVIPVGETATQRMTVVRKLSETSIQTEEYGDCSFVPMLTNKVKK